ncbi:MAG: DEAD/DEAH box helicase [Anaerolineae bacterium]|nr:DEAD/DEAH box helicase [Anaerolineae bacterium]
MAKTYVALDLETTGLDPMRDAIIEIGALRFEGEQRLETFSTFVNPGRAIPPFVTELTGITDADVQGAPSLRQATRELSQFVGRDTVIGHNVGFDLAFLRQHGVLPGHPHIDTFELAGILVPHAGRYSLANLVRELAIDLPEQTHRALDDAVMAHALFDALLQRAAQLPQQTLQELEQLGARINWTAGHFFRDARYQRQRQGFSGGIGAQLAARRGGDAAGPLFVTEEDELFEPLQPRKETRPVDVEALTALLDRDGPLAEAFPEYECRAQQAEMLQAVAQAFNDAKHLFVEAGTGTGKSLAYLIPAIEWAVQNEQRVVVSTNTINLQEQLAHKDLPELREHLYDFRSHILKGRSHYLCRHQFQTLRRRGPATDAEMRVLAKVLLWLPNTLDGDADGLFLPTAEEHAIWHNLSAANEACDPEHCRFYQGDGCFFYRARAKAEGAHILIVNHALLLADIVTENRVLPEYDLLIIDEAHHLERATTDALRYTISGVMLNRTLDELLRSTRGFPGLLDEIMGLAESMQQKTQMLLHEAVIRLQDAGERVQRQLDLLFTEIEMFMSEHADTNNPYGARLRITTGLREQGRWMEIARLWAQVSPHLATLVEGLEHLSKGVEELIAESAEMEGVQLRLVSITRRLAEAHAQLGAVVAEPVENAIYWLEARNNYPVTLSAVPLHVGSLVREHLLDKKRSVIMTSATLRVAESFDYMRERLGAESARELAVGSPFDYHSAALLYITTDVPEPRDTGHQQVMNQTLLDLFKATQGRALALFTSYSQLKSAVDAITGPLAREGISVYAQGSGSSRAQLLESFRKGEKAVLLGTRSFWEGVDVPGEALSCLVITKLPFDVPDDPLIAARAEAYEDPFNEYMVPEAVLRFTQGFGRLIRTATDMGIAVVLDQRLITKRYGSRFLESLPDPLIHRGTRKELPEIAARWLSGKSLPISADPDSDEPWGVPPPEEPPWFWGA